MRSAPQLPTLTGAVRECLSGRYSLSLCLAPCYKPCATAVCMRIGVLLIHTLQVCSGCNVPMYFHSPGVRSRHPCHLRLDKLTAFGMALRTGVYSWMCTHPPFLKRMFLPDLGSHCFPFFQLPFPVNQRTAHNIHFRDTASFMGHVLSPTSPKSSQRPWWGQKKV